MRIGVVVVIGLHLLCGTTPIAAQTSALYSQLWGKNGQAWFDESRLTDFSYAGYHRGERRIPLRTPDVSVKDFGAAGDGKTDDTAAFQAAIKESAGKTIAIPAGAVLAHGSIGNPNFRHGLAGCGNHQDQIAVPHTTQ